MTRDSPPAAAVALRAAAAAERGRLVVEQVEALASVARMVAGAVVCAARTATIVL